MQISIKGDLTMKQLRQALFEKLQEIEDEFCVEFLKGATLYFNPTNEYGEEVVLINKSGRQVTKFLSSGPYKSAAEDFKFSEC